MSLSVVTVKQLNLYVKSLLEGNQRLAYISISGEISNFKRHFASGHIYFTLKDDTASLKCVMFRDYASRLSHSLNDGMKVICTGRISVYERDGVYQLYAENIIPDGEGDLMAQFEKTKTKLDGEGLFDQALKKPIPRLPKKIAVITSQTGAAVKDILNVLERRYPLCEVLLCPATVQGEFAPESLCSALEIADNSDADLIIIGRGGGSAEDLWCFNDETLARKISSTNKPVISAVGHETDFTICDFVADLRAPTPSAAAELAVPDKDEMLSSISEFSRIISSSVKGTLIQKEKALSLITSSGVFLDPVRNLCEKRNLLIDSVAEKINMQTDKIVITKDAAFRSVAAIIESISPMKTMLRGFSVAEKDGKSINSVSNIAVGDEISLRFYDGMAKCNVENIIKE